MHTPVLLPEVIEGLQVQPGNKYIDATVGEGGHTQALLNKGAIVLGIDRSRNQITKLQETMHNDHLALVTGNFSDIASIAKKHDFKPVQGVLFDLGLSWRQLSELGRGLSYRSLNEPLDMRLDESCEETAEYVLNTYSEDDLYNMLATNSEEVKSREIAVSIIERRKARKYKKVSDLNATITKVMGGNAGKTFNRVYQALRIEVNQEFVNLKMGLEGALSILADEGRIAVISFHSLEDRIVKQFIKGNSLKMVSKKAIVGAWDLSFERSAKLRIFSI